MRPFVLGIIFARGGSKGVPGKNIKMLAGKPLIAYAISVARGVPLIDEVIVSTDDVKIAEVAREYGAKVPFLRPLEIALDNSPEILAWQHAIVSYEKLINRKIDYIVSVPATSPLRIIEDVKKCLEKLLISGADIVVTVTESERSPYFNMVTIDAEDNAKIIIQDKSINRRQDAPKAYDLTTVAYAAKAQYVLTTGSLLSGIVKAVVIPRERALDIDTMLDFEIAEFLMLKKADV